MSPFTVDEERMKGRPFKRDGIEVLPLLQMEGNNPPVRLIPHMEYPRVVYKHPNEPFTEVEHRNDKFELVGTETVVTEHLTKLVASETELKAALEHGWVKEPYIMKSMPDPKAHLYETRKAKKVE
jgi:hypothetical protein